MPRQQSRRLRVKTVSWGGSSKPTTGATASNVVNTNNQRIRSKTSEAQSSSSQTSWCRRSSRRPQAPTLVSSCCAVLKLEADLIVTKGKRGASDHAWCLADRQALQSCAVNPWGGSAVSCPQLFSKLTPVFDLYDSQDDAEVSRELLMSYLFQADTSALAPAKRRSVLFLADHFGVQAGPGGSK